MQEIEDNFKSNGGKFEEILITDIFDHIVQGRRLKKADHMAGELAFVMSGVTNTGVVGFIGNSNVRKFQSNSITIDIFGNTFYRSYPFAASDDVGVFWSDKKISSDAMIYISAVISKSLKGRFDFGNKLRASETYDFKFVLPTQNGEIAFDYMEAYIKELEADRVKELEYDRARELEAYLMATGLKDYTLTAAEQTALETFEKSIKINNLTQMGGGKPYLPAVDFQTFKIGDLFEISTPKRKFDANKITFGGKYPYVARGDKNNGIRGLITEDTQYLNNGNTISFGQDTATMFYQPEPYFTGDKIKIFSFRQPEKFNKYIALSLIATMKLGFSHFAWGASFNVKKLQEVKIQLPTQNNAIDFDFMHTFIRAIEKIVIKEVVEWADKKIQATKQVINE
ncbi:MAG: restriction endonuclease subunit S [Neisseriaceae bacterium]|nr:restriction endonuclease subunit S [Neisseriaceae bacterium]